ncbi:hypothetical protein [Bartonella sp. LJL80]
MSIDAATLRHLSSLKLSAEQMSGVLEILAGIEEKEEKRKASQRERVRRHRDNKTVTVTLQKRDCNSDKTLPLSPKRKVPPYPPKENNPYPTFSETIVSSNETRASAKREIETEFHGTFWPAYPHKVGKPVALKAFLKARTSNNLESIMAGLRGYIAHKPPDRSWMNPATFLNQERWNDQPATITEQNHASAHTDNRPSARKVIDAMRGLSDEFNARQAFHAHERGVSADFQGWQEVDPFADREDPTDSHSGPQLTLVASNGR